MDVHDGTPELANDLGCLQIFQTQKAALDHKLPDTDTSVSHFESSRFHTTYTGPPTDDRQRNSAGCE